MKKISFLILILAFLFSFSLCSADIAADNEELNHFLALANSEEEPDWTARPDSYGKIVFGLYTDLGKLSESSLEAANAGDDFYGVPAGKLAESLSEADTVIIVQRNSEITGWNGFIPTFHVCAKVTKFNASTEEIISQDFTDADALPPAGSGIDPCVYYVSFFSEWLAEYDNGEEYDGYGYSSFSDYYEDEGSEERYNEAMALYKEGRYYSAKQAFIESGYGDWEEMAEKCEQPWPATGELWHDKSQWLQDMWITFVINQDTDTAIYIRLFKNNAVVSTAFIGGPGQVKLALPGNGYYSIQDGIGRTWYGEKEAFGREGSYEDMTFDEKGTDKVYLQSYYEYTLTINAETITGDEVYSDAKDYDKFVAEGN